MSNSPLASWVMSTTTSIDSKRKSIGTERLNSVQVEGPLSIARLGAYGPKLALVSSPLLLQFCASETAAPASTAPKPNLCDTSCPPPFKFQDESLASFFLEEWTRMFWISLQVRLGFASRTRAMTPETKGVALEVPPKSCVTSPPLYPPLPVMSVVVIPS